MLLNILFAVVILVVMGNTFCEAINTSATKKRVIVTGASGRTGSLVFKKLLESSDFEPIALVRSRSALKKIGASESNSIIADTTDPESLTEAFKGADSVILCTSAVPKIKYFSLAKIFLSKIFGQANARPEFYFIEKGDPYYVDWLGAKNQIDAAKKSNVKQFVFLSSMGGTQPDNFLNTIGKKEGDDLSGNILLWKRKAEKYLVSSGLKYTIIHPGGLLDKAGGEREIVFGVDDELLKEKVRSIPRADVAEVCVQSLRYPSAQKRSFDIISKEPAQGQTTTDWKKFFSNRGNCKY